MASAKDIQLRVIDSKTANAFVKKHHYSGKIVANSSLHFGAFLEGYLHGVMSYGSPLDKRKVLPLVVDERNEPVKWNEMLELNRMAFDAALPKNAESRCIAISIKLLKKNAPHIRWLLSFADGTQCGDGTIYRASGFKLTQVKENKTLLEFPNGEHVAAMTLEHNWSLDAVKRACESLGIPHKQYTRTTLVQAGAKFLQGYQLRYIFLIDRCLKIKDGILPFSEIDRLNARMYLGTKPSDSD